MQSLACPANLLDNRGQLFEHPIGSNSQHAYAQGLQIFGPLSVCRLPPSVHRTIDFDR
jgi:hypothetical protein